VIRRFATKTTFMGLMAADSFK